MSDLIINKSQDSIDYKAQLATLICESSFITFRLPVAHHSAVNIVVVVNGLSSKQKQQNNNLSNAEREIEKCRCTVNTTQQENGQPN